ncbi:6-phosphogluconolactonase [Arthrobacter burdickii]|uniref:6-phosphogluconolactonase n=1 Tax=Arthrobacter burdickii TaxID=3035920 RepID=A0ABT8K2R7_9MICC|nr:6-phosphogluconolactonase [Arthrobacter burdickii]MDN4611705.1 6-phosphogluconolactonase [Arthrobacter burdickii]
MSAEPKVSIHPSPTSLAAAVAARLITRLVDVQSDRGTATVVLTGGSIGTAALQAVVESPAHTAVDWANVHFWWGDERFLRAEDPDRNAVQARSAFLDRIAVDPVKIHEFGSKDEFPDEDAAAADYARQLAEAARAEAEADGVGQVDPRLPRFDVLLLGVGPDAHVASLFPELAGIRTKGETTVGVADAPKPPPQRVSLTLEAINTAQEVWLSVSGSDKAGAVGLALAGAGHVQVPAAGARGVRKTLWLIDQDAAQKLPGRLIDHDDEETG